MNFPKRATWSQRIMIMLIMKGNDADGPITQGQLAEELGTTRKQVWNWTHGKRVPTPYYRKKLSQYLGVSEAQLFQGIPDKRKRRKR